MKSRLTAQKNARHTHPHIRARSQATSQPPKKTTTARNMYNERHKHFMAQTLFSHKMRHFIRTFFFLSPSLRFIAGGSGASESMCLFWQKWNHDIVSHRMWGRRSRCACHTQVLSCCRTHRLRFTREFFHVMVDKSATKTFNSWIIVVVRYLELCSHQCYWPWAFLAGKAIAKWMDKNKQKSLEKILNGPKYVYQTLDSHTSTHHLHHHSV